MVWSCGLQFRIRTGPDRGSTLPIDSPVVKIGRARQPGDRQAGWVRVADDTVSRLHCELFWQEDRKSFRLLHRSTTNSTYVNGEIVEDAELFDGDILEVGSISMELQKADLRWSQADDKAITDWPQRQHEGAGVPASVLKNQGQEGVKIPGATVATTPAGGGLKIAIGPKEPYQFVTSNDEVYPLTNNRVRLGCAVNPEDDIETETDKPKKKPHFDTHYVLEGADFSYYNLILRYDELYQGYKAVRAGPKAQEITISRLQGGLTWRSSFPEGVEVDLVAGDILLLGNIELSYQKAVEQTP